MSFKEDFMDFIDRAMTPAHFIDIARTKLLKAGYVEINEKEKQEHIPNKFFINRNNRALAVVNKKNFDTGVIVGAHIDSPVLKIVKGTNQFNQGAEVNSVYFYGGGLWMSWIDRDLKIAGRAIFNIDGKLYSKLIHSEKAVAVIPSLAVHLKSGIALKPGLKEANFKPIFKLKDSDDGESTLDKIVADLCGCDVTQLVDYEVSLVPEQKSSVTGISGDFIHSPRLDDLSCAIPSLNAIISMDEPKTGACIYLAFDNEEIGSASRCGAKSDFLQTVLDLAGADSSFLQRSILVSADVAQGYNPNFKENYNEDHHLSIGQGIMYSYCQNMSFATNAPIKAFIQKIADEENINISPFVNKHFVPSGTTIGPHINSKYGVVVIDIGVPLLAMHSIREMGSLKDIENYQNLISAIFDHIEDVPTMRNQLD
ncbi:putative M18 family aminopeptidase 2 [Tritrichomonas foetus]|uniref:aspartyl aminopeptidase n=1 Tax=Tritrichomonas foetus TaxID=1144522 RepID=A0A1J4K099_9EUKA|nr:putative M18 family aminopeptidase 2 [Tritrichomonas foetus]|eukprot:OHT03166.1 putative M18 family aminopeptidase 2 [Tritrichomonas foetus]